MTALGLALALAGCAEDVAVPPPADLSVAQIGYGVRGTVEIRFELVVRAERYLIGYDNDGAEPYDGSGLSLVVFPERCGDFDAAAAAGDGTRSSSATDGASEGGAVGDGGVDAPGDGAGGDGAGGDGAGGDGAGGDGAKVDAKRPDSTVDAIGPGRDADSPIEIPAEWCLDTQDTFSDAGVIPVRTPGKQPRVRLQNLEVGKTYYFAVKAGRRAALSVYSAPVKITIKATK